MSTRTFSLISPRSLHELQQRDPSVEFFDVRTPMEFEQVHARGARPIPLDSLDPAALLPARKPGQPLYVICKSGGRARKACQKLVDAGHADVVSVEGGTDAWVAAGLPVERNERTVISLERQVRIAAGLLVLTGAVLALTVSHWFVLLSGFVGAGLVFAGITDTCGMGLMLARAPWNRTGAAGGAAACVRT